MREATFVGKATNRLYRCNRFLPLMPQAHVHIHLNAAFIASQKTLVNVRFTPVQSRISGLSV